MAVHLGWRGAANGLGPKSIRHFCAELSLQPSDLVAAIGPCIGFDKFVVRSDVVDALKKSVAPEGLVQSINETQFKVDLQGWVERQLQEIGVTQIEKIGHCTFTEADIFYSARRDSGSAGRQVSCIKLSCRT
jgi:copper oxidase (laccase) domain-containing protein